MKVLNNFTPELWKGPKAEVGNKEHKPSIYYQKPASPNQHKTLPLDQLPESEFDVLVLDLIDDYLVEEPMAKEEKETVQEPSKVSGIVKDEDMTFMYCQKFAEIETANKPSPIVPYPRKASEVKKIKNKRIDVRPEDHQASDCIQNFVNTRNGAGCHQETLIAIVQNNYYELGVEDDCQEQVEAIKNKSKSFEVKLEDRVKVKNDVAESANVGDINRTSIKSQALPYDQRSIETVEAGHMSSMIEPNFK
ncbi:hypothetical protein F8M41_022284 [Gigaspora margarita]|uniref:Uncharacterized protein n=1 Tax=Gigaspora margarita TaxID=4874 RepID=A0A8H4AFB4_GIGMA|nr:hypothetical protein F8M41_022284 [Gigaspora margarita]